MDKNKNSKKILIIDDEMSSRVLLAKILEDDYTILLAENGKRAVGVIENTKPDLIISDLNMPEMNGFELLKYVKTNYRSVKMIIMSGIPRNLMEIKMMGALDFFTKPPDFDKFKSKVDYLLYKERRGTIRLNAEMPAVINNKFQAKVVNLSSDGILFQTSNFDYSGDKVEIELKNPNSRQIHLAGNLIESWKENESEFISVKFIKYMGERLCNFLFANVA